MEKGKSYMVFMKKIWENKYSFTSYLNSLYEVKDSKILNMNGSMDDFPNNMTLDEGLKSIEESLLKIKENE